MCNILSQLNHEVVLLEILLEMRTKKEVLGLNLILVWVKSIEKEHRVCPLIIQ